MVRKPHERELANNQERATRAFMRPGTPLLGILLEDTSLTVQNTSEQGYWAQRGLWLPRHKQSDCACRRLDKVRRVHKLEVTQL